MSATLIRSWSPAVVHGHVHLAAAGLGLGQLAICVLGVLVISSEYSTGAIRASLLAVPLRLPMLAAKAVVCDGARPGGQRGHGVRDVLHHHRDPAQPRVDHAQPAGMSPGPSSARSCT